MDELRGLAVAALLHDIGKFMQRAEPGTKKDYRHPALSKMFFQEEQTGIEFNESKEFLEMIKFLVSHHHEEDLDRSGGTGNLRALAEILSEADNISSRERDDTSGGKQLALMSPIFLGIKNFKSKENYRYKIAPLDFSRHSKITIPIRADEINASGISSLYIEQWKKFLEDFKKALKIGNRKLEPDLLYFLEEKYLWCVPSAYFRSNTDISLFEHSKVTAAAATSLYLSLKKLHPEVFEETDPVKIRKTVKDPDEKRFLLAGIDVNGIQKFIYSISSKKALKSLKGRSFYVQTISNILVHELLWDEGINLYETNIIYLGGGRAYLLLPITSKDAVEEVANRINKALFEKYGTELSATVGYAELSARDLSREKVQLPDGREETRISLSWGKLANELSKRRGIKFTKIIESDYKKFFEPIESGGYFREDGTGDKRVICAICKKEIPESEAEEESGLKICKECKTLIGLGEKLQGERMYLTLSKGTQQNTANALPLSIKGLKIRAYVSENPFLGAGARSLSLNVKDTNLDGGGFLLNSGGASPVNELSDLAPKEGFKRIGILRMDIDNLGMLFKDGIDPSIRTLSRISQLSSSVSMFFKGHLKEILEDEEFKNSVYVVYAGGDDLFALGNWKVMPEFAKRVKDDFYLYVCKNPAVTLSAGIFLIKDKYPIARGAEYAGDAEEEAKSYEFNGKRKNAVFFLGKAMSWNDFEIAQEIKEKLTDAYSLNAKGDKSVIRRLQVIYSLYKRSKKMLASENISPEEIERKARWTKWMWMLAYYIGRSRKKEFLESIKTALMTDVFEGKKSEKQIISYLDVPANWADLLTR